MPLKLSRYTHLFKKYNNFYIFNSESCIFLEISPETYNFIEAGNINKLSRDEKTFFEKKKIIVPDDEFDMYLYESKLKYSINSYRSDVLSLVLIPTTRCNFNCPYCFEKSKQDIVMQDDVINELNLFIKGHVNAKKISITWYGGEPLLGFKIIKKINASIRENTDIPIVHQTLITNGYLLDEKKILSLKEIGLNSVQITLDGAKNSHNLTRSLEKTKKGSYDVIINNIDKLLSVFPECAVSLRINISNKNKDEFIPLYKELSIRWESKKIYIYPGFIRENTVNNCSFSRNTLNSDERYAFYKDLKNNECNVNFYPRRVDKGCMINCINDYIIGPEGEIYKCWNDVTNPNKIIGYINQKHFTQKKLFYSYMEKLSPFEDLSCKECFLFPICSGGCGWYRFKNYFESGKFDLCPYYKNKKILKELLLLSSGKNNANKNLKKINGWS